MSEEQSAMMTRLQQLGLTLNDLTIYLDTHLYDDYAKQRFNSTAAEYRQLAEEYDVRFGPLIVNQTGHAGAGWQWALQDFPWDF